MKKFFSLLLLIVLLLSCSFFALTACNDKKVYTASIEDIPSTENPNDFYIIDNLGNKVKFDSKPKRLAMMSGSFADLAQKVGGDVVCYTVDAIEERKMTFSEDSINAGSLKNPNAESIIKSNPDIVVMSSELSSHIKLRESLVASGLKVVMFRTETFEEYLDLLAVFSYMLDNNDAYYDLGLSIKNDIEKTIKKAQEKNEEKSVLLMRAFSTKVKARDSKNLVGDIIKDLGGVNIAEQGGSIYPDLELSNELIVQADPDYIFVVVMGDYNEALSYLKDKIIDANPKLWNSLSAVKNDRFIILEKDYFHYKPNEKWNVSYEKMFDYLYNR